MIATIILDKPNPLYTNLDVLSGKVILKVPSTTTVSHVTVKLEGECKTRLAAPIHPNARSDRPRPVLEIHKVLYRASTIWPPNNVQIVQESRAAYSLNAGEYVWPFEFKIPLNNSCDTQPVGAVPQIKFGGGDVEVARPPTHHVKKTLPPTLGGLPGEAEVKYFVKVTVARPQFYKENLRAFANFNFLPIEPPRTAKDGEAYARRQHQFLPETGEKRRSLLGSMKGSQSEKGAVSSDAVPPRFSVDVRLPNPAVLTCNGELPIRIILKQLTERRANVYMQSLHIELIGYTKVRAHELNRTESSSQVITSLSNMAIPLGSPDDPVNTEIPINQEYWYGNKLPSSVAPSFETCNLSRNYELEVRVGLGYGSYKRGEDQLTILPLRLPVLVYSGIAPPPALLDAMTHPPPAIPPRDSKSAAATNPSFAPPRVPLNTRPSVDSAQSSMNGTGSGFGVTQPARQGAPAQPARPGQGEFEEPPPSYEDAIGANSASMAGKRGNYETNPAAEAAVASASASSPAVQRSDTPSSAYATPTEGVAAMSMGGQPQNPTAATDALDFASSSPNTANPSTSSTAAAPISVQNTGLSSNNPFAPQNTGATTTNPTHENTDGQPRKDVRFGDVR